MPGSEHHYGMRNGGVVRDWYCDTCQVLTFEKVTCLEIKHYPLVICPKCSKAKEIAESLMDTIGMEYPYGIYIFRDHLVAHLRNLDEDKKVLLLTLREIQLNTYSLKRAFKKVGKELKSVEEEYLI